MSGDPYVYAGTNVLKNRLDITDPDALDFWERERVIARYTEGTPSGNFDLKHLRAIHHHLFQDIYEWAGELRTVEISKGGDQFMFCRYIENGMADVHRRLVEDDFLVGLSALGFAAKAGEIIGDINHAHPFREGNGRTQMSYLQSLAAQAGHEIDVRRIKREAWYAASRAANNGHYSAMVLAIAEAIVADV